MRPATLMWFKRTVAVGLFALVAITRDANASGAPGGYFRIHVVDASDSRPLAGVELRTVNHIVLTSDVNGNIAFHEPGLMGLPVWFTVSRRGFLHPAIMNFRGTTLTPKEGGSAILSLPRAGGPIPNPGISSDESTVMLSGPVPERSRLFQIKVVDAQTGRGVPLVEVKSPTRSYFTDSGGLVAFYEPRRMNTKVAFRIASDGYTYRNPATGKNTVAVLARSGGAITVEVDRINIAQRLYRVTGQGIYRDSVLLGAPTPIADPVMNNGRVMGQDSTQTALFKGKVFWVWGDTANASFPLGNFSVTAATSKLPEDGGLDPDSGVDLAYFTGSDGFVKAMVPNIAPPGVAIWPGALIAVDDGNGNEVLTAHYGKVRTVVPETFEFDEWGVVKFDDARQVFVPGVVFPPTQPSGLGGHAFRWKHGTVDYVYHDNPVYEGHVRVEANLSKVLTPEAYEVFTPYLQGTRTVERDSAGHAVYRWRTGTRAASDESLAARDALRGHLTDVDTGRVVRIYSRSMNWNPYRQRWVSIMAQKDGHPSRLGEYYYVEGDTPMGPFEWGRKVVTHRNHSFYNPQHHALFDKGNGRFIFFEGTYSLFKVADQSDSQKTPRYIENQIMYELDLADGRLRLPVPIYDVGAGGLDTKRGLRTSTHPSRAFWAYEEQAPGTIPVFWDRPSCARRALTAGHVPVTAPVFHAYPKAIPQLTTPLWEFVESGGTSRRYSIDSTPMSGFTRRPAPLVHVIPGKSRVDLPVTDYLDSFIADAGSDTCATEASVGAGADIRLDAGDSLVPEGQTATYTWSWLEESTSRQANGRTVTVRFPVGLHDVALTVTRGDGQRRTDHTTVEVASRG